jgi:hypothetical protein
MAEFTMKIAGYAARVTSLFESTPQYFRPYLTEETPRFFFAVTREDIAFESRFLYEEALAEGFKVRNFPDPFLERAAIQRKFAEALFDLDVLLLHGSTVAVDGSAYLFTARSGTGKSTHTRLWREAFGSRAVMINDDKPFLKVTPEGVTACGAPWSGKHGLDTNITVPLKGICLLERGAENHIQPLPQEDALVFLQKQCHLPAEPEKYSRLLELLQMLTRQVPLWHMTCTKDLQAAHTAYQAMHR